MRIESGNLELPSGSLEDSGFDAFLAVRWILAEAYLVTRRFDRSGWRGSQRGSYEVCFDADDVPMPA